MDQEVDGSSTGIQHHVVAVQRSVCTFAKLLVVDSGHSAHEGVNHKHEICGIRVSRSRIGIVLGDNETTNLILPSQSLILETSRGKTCLSGYCCPLDFRDLRS
jgi:hypothetical protein